MAKTPKRKTGDVGEDKACLWLTAHGFSIVGRNISNRYGEIDIIAQKGNVVHFVEVKTRGSDRFGSGVEAVSGQKLQKVIRCAQVIAEQTFPNHPFSIDAISIDIDNLRFFENITL